MLGAPVGEVTPQVDILGVKSRCWGGVPHPRPLTTLCPPSLCWACRYLSSHPSFPLVGCPNGAPGLSLFHCSVLCPHIGVQLPLLLARCVQSWIGAATYGGKGFNERARVSGERPMGAASYRQQYNQASCQPPPPRRLTQVHAAFLKLVSGGEAGMATTSMRVQESAVPIPSTSGTHCTVRSTHLAPLYHWFHAQDGSTFPVMCWH